MSEEHTTTDSAELVKPYILIVDPDPVVEKLLRRDSRLAAYEMTFVPDAANARRLMQERLPDLFIVDPNLPDVPGREFINELCRLPAFAGRRGTLPLISFGASYGHTVDLDKPEPMWITKPFNPQELAQYIRHALLRCGVPVLPE